jgi:hypothetical protein
MHFSYGKSVEYLHNPPEHTQKRGKKKRHLLTHFATPRFTRIGHFTSNPAFSQEYSDDMEENGLFESFRDA